MKNKKVNPKDNQANIPNRNKGTLGQNQQAAKNQGNKGKQENPNRKKP